MTSATGTYYYLGVPTCRAFKEYGEWSNRRCVIDSKDEFFS